MIAASACEHLREDHREMEAYLDRLLAALQRLGPERIAEAQAAVRDIRRLSSIHFEKEEVIFYPSLRPAFPDLLARMDQQHDEVREVAQHVGDLLSDPPPTPESRWLNDLKLFGTELYDLIQHHIVEEEDQLFRLAESQLTTKDQERLTVEMTKLHTRLSARFGQ
jgi:hemerythrin-like domain-containing protein